MYGSGMGSLSVEISIDGGSTWSSSLSTISGNQGNIWRQGTVYLNAYTSATNAIIRFKGVTGTSYASDIAIDDVKVEEEVGCSAITSFPYSMNFDGLSPNNSNFWYCQTEDNIVGLAADCWSNASSNPNMWVARSSSSPSSNTGPSSDHTSGSGNYVFLEASSCGSKTSYLYSKSMDFSSLTNPTLSYYYHMYGTSMGSLSVEVSTDGGSTWSSSLSTISGNQGNAWHHGTVDLSAYTSATNAVIRFTGITGISYASDIGIDDVTVEEAVDCSPVTSFPYSMNFDGLLPNNSNFWYCQTADNIVGSAADCWT